jgi:hypothetical protein
MHYSWRTFAQAWALWKARKLGGLEIGVFTLLSGSCGRARPLKFGAVYRIAGYAAPSNLTVPVCATRLHVIVEISGEGSQFLVSHFSSDKFTLS